MLASRQYAPSDEHYRNVVNVYESDFGVCRVLTSRWIPTDTVVMLDSSRVQVMPLKGRSFQYRSLASTGDSTVGMLVGEYTLELRNETPRHPPRPGHELTALTQPDPASAAPRGRGTLERETRGGGQGSGQWDLARGRTSSSDGL